MQNDNQTPLVSDESPQTPEQPAPGSAEPVSPQPAPPLQVVSGGPGSHRRLWMTLALLVILVLAGVVGWMLLHRTSPVTPTKSSAQKSNPTADTGILKLDPNKDYGNKYASGVLPVGDGKYDSSAAKKGYVYTCSQYAQNLARDQGGAGSRGSWFTNNNTQYDINKKLHVQGSVMWQAEFSNQVSGSTRTITTNDLPSHPTGVFPIAMTDPAYQYDRNPNSIAGQTMTYSLPTSPTYGSAHCMSGEVGVMLTGIALFNGFDAGGRDAGAWEIQDNCSGHPQKEGEYHYHTLSSCVKDISVKTVIGYALDGFPITGPQVGTNNILTTSDLDECHGITSQVTADGKTFTSYHYVMTQDFPYSASCFRAAPTSPPNQPQGNPQRP